MKLRYIQSGALLIWGLQTDLYWFAIPMAILWEGQFLLNRRWALTQQDFYRVGDLTGIVFAGVLIFLFLNRTDYHFIITLVRWLPILFYPLVIVFAFSTTEKMTLDVVFYSLRRQKQAVTQSWDMNYILFALCIVAAGTNMSGINFYFPLACLLVCLALLPLRSPRYGFKLWIVVISITFVSAFITQKSVRATHVELKHRIKVWVSNWIQQRNNPLKTLTAIGSVGELKLSDEILFRVDAPPGTKVPALLQEASYDLFINNDWTVMKSSSGLVEHADDFRWELAATGQKDHLLNVYLEFKYEKSLVPLPAGSTEIDDLPALDIKRNYYGAIEAEGLVPSPKYNIRFQYKGNITGKPLGTDSLVPKEYVELFSTIARENNLDQDQPIASVIRFFNGFKYSLYQGSTGPDPISNFLLETRQGHCEYFASASVLLLRQLGIPARYVIGYAVQEYSSMLDMFIVRQRHAHAWAIAYVNGVWQVVDTTPSIWAEAEADQSNFLRPLFDLIANTNFVFQVWRNEQKLEDYKIHLYVIGTILALILAWRIMTSEQVIINKPSDSAPETPIWSGSDSPFLKLEELLQEAGYKRGRGELLGPWLSRIGYAHLIRLLRIHNQWRFDPNGISHEQENQLVTDVSLEIAQISSRLQANEKPA